jgi:soluble lytic murein transglycosylase-like protein
MRRAAVLLLVLAAAVLVACGDGDTAAEPRAPSVDRASLGDGRSTIEPGERPLPAPDGALPRTARALADDLNGVDLGLRAAIDAWTADGPPRTNALPDDVVAFALRQQRILRALSRRPAQARRVLARIPLARRAEHRSILAAMASLRRLAGPPRPGAPRIRIGPSKAPERLLTFYRAARKRFGVRVHTLAAVNFVETAFGKLRNNSWAGAQGPMQFIPSTWKAYGLGGNVRNVRDAIMGAANYLRATGAPRDTRGALYRYNPSSLYVDAVSRYARLIARDRRWFYALYAWQVYVRDGKGRERRITGPGIAPTR